MVIEDKVLTNDKKQKEPIIEFEGQGHKISIFENGEKQEFLAYLDVYC